MSQLTIAEDGGLAVLLGTETIEQARAAVVDEATVLQAVRAVLQQAFADPQRQHFLDPFAPAAVRNTEVIAVLRAAIVTHRRDGGPLAQVPTDRETLLALFAATLGWGPAQRYLDDAQVNEVKIIGRHIRVQEAGAPFVMVPEQFADTESVLTRALLLASVLGVRLDAETPQATLPVAHGTRLHVSIPPRTMDSALVCIRRGRQAAWDIDDLRARGTLNGEVAALLRLFSRARCSVLIAGRTGSGKTGLLEALANSWVGEPHIISIEDHTMEIGIRHAERWTREVVDTQRDPHAFGRVAREALRQTPDLLLPGEIRGSEAGAVLALVCSDHPVITTVHARSCTEAVLRFAACAALPGAYMYEGRRTDALRDASSGFAVVITVEGWEETGLRLITEIALLDGAEMRDGVIQPCLTPLVTVVVQPDGTIGWSCAAHCTEEGRLAWCDGVERTPTMLRALLGRAAARPQVSAAPTTLDAVRAACTRAEALLQAGDAERALATLQRAWGQRHDPRLLVCAQHTLAYAPGRFAALEATAATQAHTLDRLIQGREWGAAQRAYRLLLAEVGMAAAALPIGGWEAIDTCITDGLAQVVAAERACHTAALALAHGQPRVAADAVLGIQAHDLPSQTALTLLRVREAALAALLACGEGSEAALLTVRTQRMALEQEGDTRIT